MITELSPDNPKVLAFVRRHEGERLLVVANLSRFGEALRSLNDHRAKRSPLRDVAALLRSLHYASAHAVSSGPVRREDLPALMPWAGYWRSWVSAACRRDYLDAAAGAVFLPAEPQELRDALEGYLLEKALQELSLELSLRADWIGIPLRGVLQLVEGPPWSG